MKNNSIPFHHSYWDPILFNLIWGTISSEERMLLFKHLEKDPLFREYFCYWIKGLRAKPSTGGSNDS